MHRDLNWLMLSMGLSRKGQEEAIEVYLNELWSQHVHDGSYYCMDTNESVCIVY